MAPKGGYMLASVKDPDAPDSGKRLSLPQRPRKKWSTVILSLLLFTSVFLHLILYFHRSESIEQLELFTVKSWSGLPYDKQLIYTHSNEYWDPRNPEDRAPDALWNTLSSQPVAVAIDNSWARQHGLPVTDPWPWDDDKGLFYIKAFHDLHCVKIIREAYHYALRGEKFTLAPRHLDHCFDALRQDIICHADDTPMPVNSTKNSFGDGQYLQCRDWEKLVEWTQHPDRQACYNNFDDYHDWRPSLELFSYCPNDSKYSSVVSKYFEKFGHEKLWALTD